MARLQDPSQEGVVLLHGIARTRRSMQPLEKFLIAQGFRTLNIDYPSRLHPINDIATLLRPQLTAFAADVPRLHMVTYSMGGTIARTLLHQWRPENLGRVVMLGPPHQGSEIASLLKNFWLYRKFYGPAGQELVLRDAFQEAVDYELGIIAGDRPLDLLSSWLIGKPNDGKVSVDSTRLAGMADHIVLPIDHTFMPASKTVWQQVLSFLQNGGFCR